LPAFDWIAIEMSDSVREIAALSMERHVNTRGVDHQIPGHVSPCTCSADASGKARTTRAARASRSLSFDDPTPPDTTIPACWLASRDTEIEWTGCR